MGGTMMGTMICLATLALGIDVGWEPSGEGLEYIIQIEPEMLDSLRAGTVIQSDVRSELRDIRSYRIQVGTGAVPRIDLPEPKVDPIPPQATPEIETPPANAAADAGAALELPPAAPQILPPSAAERHIAERAEYQSPAKPTEVAPTTTAETPSAEATSYFTPMMLFAGTSLGLLAALVYLGWIHLGVRSQYRALLAEQLSGKPIGPAVSV